MGKAKRWSPEESAHLAEAWTAVSEDHGAPKLKGTNQTKENFWLGVVAKFKTLALTVAAGTCHEQGMSLINGHWNDGVVRDTKKFNKCPLKV